MEALLAYLVALDGAVMVGVFLGFVALLLFLPGLIVRLGSTERLESMSERHERLDTEARAAANVAAYESMPKEALR